MQVIITLESLVTGLNPNEPLNFKPLPVSELTIVRVVKRIDSNILLVEATIAVPPNEEKDASWVVREQEDLIHCTCLDTQYDLIRTALFGAKLHGLKIIKFIDTRLESDTLARREPPKKIWTLDNALAD